MNQGWIKNNRSRQSQATLAEGKRIETWDLSRSGGNLFRICHEDHCCRICLRSRPGRHGGAGGPGHAVRTGGKLLSMRTRCHLSHQRARREDGALVGARVPVEWVGFPALCGEATYGCGSEDVSITSKNRLQWGRPRDTKDARL